MNFRKSDYPDRTRPAYEGNRNPYPPRTPASENLIRIDGENVSVSLLVQNPGLKRALERGTGRWCLHNPCRAPNHCHFLHRRDRHTEQERETHTSAVQVAFELVGSADPLGTILGDESKKQGFQDLLRVTDSTQYIIPIVHRMMASFNTSTPPLSAVMAEVRGWCDAWVIRCTEQIDKFHAWPPNDQNCFFTLMYDVCKRDPTSPDTRRGLEEVTKLSSIPPEERQRATELLQNTESNIKVAEGDEESDEKQKRYVVNKMYHNAATPVFNSAVWPSSATELRSFFSELKELPGLVVDRFIPRDLRGLHLRVLQHLSRADFMHSLSSIASIVQEKGPDALKRNRQQHGFEQRFHVHHLVFKYVNSNPYDGLLARFSVREKNASHKARFLSGDLVLLWQEGIPMNSENCFLAIVKGDDNGVVALSPVDVLRCWPFLKSGACFVLVRSQHFYLPTAASLAQLRIQESKVTDDTDPDLLHALIIGDGADNPPIYLQHNPVIELGCCVALEDGSNSPQPALSNWPGCEWSEEAEAKFREESYGETALLDQTQMDALQHIMRNQVAVVQGTPGTGKSFVGSKFLQILLRNRKELGIGPIVVMTFTHHALESVFESLVAVAQRYKVDIGLLGKTKSAELAPYIIPMRRQRSETAEALINVIQKLDAVKSYTSVSLEAEDKILSVMSTHMGPNTYNEWKQRCRMYRENWRYKQEEYSKLRNKVSNKLCIRIPDSLEALEKMSLALETKQWHGEVDIMPFLETNFQIKGNPHFDEIRATLNDIATAKCVTPLDESFVNDLVESVEDYIFLLPDGQKSIINECIYTFVRELGNLIALMKQVPAAHMSLMELWRIEGIGEGQALPQLADMTAAANESTEDTNQAEAVDAQLEEFQREDAELRRQERDLDNDVAELDEDKHQMTFFSLPPKEERNALARDACNRMATASPGEERSRLLSMLLQEEIFALQEKLNALVAKLNDEKEVAKRREAEMNARELSRYAVIGATSTKLMLSVDAIQRCGASVLVVEEAAEVLESHLLACITESIQHVVLIGDHKQLKPKVNEYTLERHHNLAVSTMERMVLCGLPCVTLTMQRRMTPEISELTKPYYRRTNVAGDTAVDIEDHPRTLNIPPPFGVCHDNGTPIRLFFLSHDGQGEKAESMRNALMSPENIFEAKLVACIAQYLMNLNAGKSITILAPYSGQQFALFKELDKLCIPRRNKFIDSDTKSAPNEGVRLSTVDDYQGEEDDIIILSLVRTEKPGFLRLDNRACVALSRARSALYVVGCGALLSGASALWAHLEKTCRTKQCVENRFPARCNHHPERDLSFSCAEEYKMHRARCPDQCGREMDCGHMCESRCHAKREHPPCQKKCERVKHLCIPPRLCRHVCPKKCSAPCGKCEALVDYTYPECGHCVKLHCYQLDELLPPCTVMCKQEADCGHEVEAPCVEHMNHTSLRRCNVKCDAHMSCGHVCRQKCHYGKDDDHVQAMAKCTRPRSSTASCGHVVEHKCNQKDIASLCRAQCKKIVTLCRQEGNKSLCKLNCGHKGSCDCKEKITVKLSCGHTSDPFICASTDPPPICLAPCSAKLECAHQCGGECGVCSRRKFHSDCNKPGKTLVCGHNSKLGCAATVNICEELCTFHCGHGTPCNKLGNTALHKCSECPSRMCMEPCQWQCPHGKCNKKCCEPCEFEITVENTVYLSSGCWRRCEKKLPCGHQCCGLCGERCPSFCRECYKAGDKKALELAEKVMTYIDDEEILRTDNSAKAQSLVELPCCQVIFAAKELTKFFEGKAEAKEISAITCPQCRAIILPKVFRHAGVFIKKRLLAATRIMKRVSDAVKEQTEHGVKEVITYIKEELKFSKIAELNKIIEKLRKMTQPKKKNGKKENPATVWSLFESSCTELGLGQKWVALLRYHLEVLEKALGNLRKNDSRIAQNANILSGAALRFTIMTDAISTDLFRGYPCELFCAENVKQLVKTPKDLAKCFPSAQKDDGEVKWFADKMEWTWLLCHLEPYTDLGVPSIRENVEFGKYFATRGVRPDEVDRAEKIKNELKNISKQMRIRVRYVAKALGLSAGHWFSCPNGHLYAIGDCGGAMETSNCPECGERIGGNNHALDRNNRFAGELLQEGATPSWPTVLVHQNP